MTEQEAIRNGVKHWEENKLAQVSGGEIAPIGPGSCELCTMYSTDNEKHEHICPKCPLKEEGQTCCVEWQRCYDIMWDCSQAEWERVCDAMIDKLKSLLEKP